MKTIILLIILSTTLCSCSLNPMRNSVAAEINTQLAMAYLIQEHDAPRAKLKLLLAQQQAPTNPVVWYVTGYFLESTNDIASAEQAYLRAIKLAPHSGATHNNYGAFLCRQERYTQAVEQFLLAVHDPDYLDVGAAYENAGRCALKIPDKNLADKFFHLAIVR